MTRMDNQDKLWLPLNPITESLYYTGEDSTNMRVIVSALTKHPTVWTITKCESAQPFGIQKLTIYQNVFNKNTDYVNLETGEMYADYFNSGITPVDPSLPTLSPTPISAKISASTSTLKVGGSYKNFTVNIYNNSDDITTKYSDATFDWACAIDGEDWTEKVTWRNGNEFNQKKLKFPNDISVIGKILTVECTVSQNDTITKSELLQLELVE